MPLHVSMSQGSLIFVVGKNEGLLTVSGRRHNADDLVATALAVEPVKTVYRGRYVEACQKCLHMQRIVDLDTFMSSTPTEFVTRE